MGNNIFQFGSNFFLQKTGTAMGTPCACILATIYYGFYERNFLLPKYKKYIAFYRRFIDDCFYIWNDDLDTSESNIAFDEFKKDMDRFGRLRWTHTELSTNAIFLDLNISINKKTNELIFKTHQKK